MSYLKSNNIQLLKFTERFVTAEYVGWLNDHEVTRYMATGRLPVSNDEVFVPSVDKHKTIMFAIISHHSDAPKYIGTISLHNIDFIIRKAEVGYMIGSRDHWGKGVATEAVGLVTDYGFGRLNLNKISAGVISGNRGSSRVLEKNGYKSYAIVPQDYYLEGKYLDGALFYKLQEWHNADKSQKVV